MARRNGRWCVNHTPSAHPRGKAVDIIVTAAAPKMNATMNLKAIGMDESPPGGQIAGRTAPTSIGTFREKRRCPVFIQSELPICSTSSTIRRPIRAPNRPLRICAPNLQGYRQHQFPRASKQYFLLICAARACGAPSKVKKVISLLFQLRQSGTKLCQFLSGIWGASQNFRQDRLCKNVAKLLALAF